MTRTIGLGDQPVTVPVPTAADMHTFGKALAAVLRPGDLIVLTGPLGAGKTTLTQGIGAGLGVTSSIVSPTFTIAREYRSSQLQRPNLVHVDAYRLGSFDELDALDLDSSLDISVTVVEWGEGIVEVLTDDRLEITINRQQGFVDESKLQHIYDEPRSITLHSVGQRWAGVDIIWEGAQ